MKPTLPSDHPRKSWEEFFKEIAQGTEAKLLYPELFELESDNEDWQW